MLKTTLKIANITVQVIHNFDYLSVLCKDYISQETPEITIEVSLEDMEAERVGPVLLSKDGYLESLAFFRKFSEILTKRGIILFHSCVVEVNDKAYMFTAPSGTGKSTHASLWLELLGDKAKIINGDKPFVGFEGDIPMMYSTPYMGKEGWGYNGTAPIAGICFIYRSENNTISKITPSNAFAKAYAQTLIPKDTMAATVAMGVLAKLLETVPLYSLGCNISLEAAKLSYTTMTGELI